MGKYITIEQRCLLNINTILIEGRINDHTTLYISEALKHFYEMFRYRKDPEKTLPDLNIKINSTGGSYRESLFIFHLLEMYDGKTTATVEMLACSGAAVIFTSL
jgi:ATP-dependent protease ClpP protease subunit